MPWPFWRPRGRPVGSTGSWTPLAACPPGVPGRRPWPAWGPRRAAGGSGPGPPPRLWQLTSESICPWGGPYLLTGPGGPKAYAFVPIFQYGRTTPVRSSLLRFPSGPVLHPAGPAGRHASEGPVGAPDGAEPPGPDRPENGHPGKGAGHRPGPGAPAPDGRPGHRQPPRHPQGPDHPHGGKLLRSGDEAHPNSPVPPSCPLSRTRPSTTRTTPRPRTGRRS